MKALGIDVSKSRQLDLVGMDSASAVIFGPYKVTASDLSSAIAHLDPDVIAIDSPPEWATFGKIRPVEVQLARMGIHAFPTPAVEHRRPLHEWMESGFKAFEIAKTCGYPLFRGDNIGPRHSIEVFPHASAVVLRGGLPNARTAKRIWRREALTAAGVTTDHLSSEDELDAALAALTGVRFLQGRTCVVGQPGYAVLVLPIEQFPTQRYVRN